MEDLVMRNLSGSLTKTILAVLTTFILSGVVLAQPSGMMHPGMDRETAGQMTGYGRGGGPGWMGNMMGGGYGMGCGYGMGGYGMGMGGYGMGGMMGGYMGGMMGGMMGNFYGLNLTKDQRKKIRDLRQKMLKTNFPLMSKLMDESDKLYDLYSQATPNPKDVGKVYESIFSIKRKMIENHVQTRNSIYALLTDEQKKELKNEEPYYGRHGMMMY
jgi:protein CpxP